MTKPSLAFAKSMTENMHKECQYASVRSLLLLRASLFLALAFVSFSGFATEFEVEGDAVYNLYSGHDMEMSRTNSFIVSVRDAEWLIVTWPLGSSNRLECAWDTNFLRTLNAVSKEGTNGTRIWSNAALVERRAFPSLDDPFLRTLWLTYCSSSYLQSAPNGKIEPIWNLDDPRLKSEDFRLKGKWVVSEFPPHLPVELAYISDGIYHGYDRAKKQPMEIRLRPPYDGGYTCAVFRANSFTNLNGSGIPLEFFFKTSQTPLGSQITPDMPRDVMLGEVRTARSRSSVDAFLPQYEGTASIHDFTVVDAEKIPKENLLGNFVTYNANDGNWPAGSELESLVYQYTRKVALWKKADAQATNSVYRSQISSINHRSMIIRILLLTSLVTVALIPLVFGRKRKSY